MFPLKCPEVATPWGAPEPGWGLMRAKHRGLVLGSGYLWQFRKW